MLLHGLLPPCGYITNLYPGAQAQFTHRVVIDFIASTFTFCGIFLFMAAVFFLAAAVLYFRQRVWFWIPAAVGIVISQILITICSEDSRYGTVFNVVMFIIILFSAAGMYFQNMVTHEIKELMSQSDKTERIVTPENVHRLPQIVQHWLDRSGVVGENAPNTVRVIQRGTLRTKSDGRWMPFHAVQHFSIDPPAFVWDARIKAAPLIVIGARDKYFEGHGNMLIKPMFLFNAADSAGKEIDEGTLLRYMAEMAWFPQSATSRLVRWEGIDETRARITMDYQGVSASGTFYFNTDGFVRGFEARRYGEFQGIYRKENWSMSVTGYRAFNGVTIGNKCEVTWKLREGDFTWLNMEVTDVQTA